jgi:20S proteasome subunit alpha 4
VETEALTAKLAIKALLEVVQSGGKNLEVCVMQCGQSMRMMGLAEIEAIVAEVEKEKEEEAAQKKKEKQSEKK